jgi:hypothetical protein
MSRAHRLPEPENPRLGEGGTGPIILPFLPSDLHGHTLLQIRFFKLASVDVAAQRYSEARPHDWDIDFPITAGETRRSTPLQSVSLGGASVREASRPRSEVSAGSKRSPWGCP